MMRRRDAFWLMAAPLLGQNGIEAGAARRIITPDPLLPVSGGMGTPAPATRKLGELTTRALVLRQGATTVALVSVDLIGFPAVLGNRVRKLVSRIPADHILIGATHTHSAPDAYAFPDGKGGHTASMPYLDFVVEQMAAALNEACDRLAPAEIRIASGPAAPRIAYNYYAPDLYDRELSALELRRPDGAPVATLVNFAIHPEVLGNDQGVLSPDLVGPLYEVLDASGGVSLFLNGAQGGMVTADNRLLDQIKDPVKGYWKDERSWAECGRIGRLLATETQRLLSKAAWQRDLPLTIRTSHVQFPVESDQLWAVVQHSPLQYPHGPGRHITTQVNYLELGPARLLSIPGEALPNIGLYLRRKLGGRNVFLLGLTNDAFGYILTAVDYASFERYQYVSRVSLGEQTGEIYIREALKLAGR